MEQFLGGLQILLNWQNFLIIPVGLVIGIVVGAIPGLTSDLGIILCIPLTYGMDPTMAILMLLAIYCGGTYGGSITAILINTPGTSANAATLFDGYPMTVKGQAFKALQMALYASTIGGLISAFSVVSGSADREDHSALWPCGIFCAGGVRTVCYCWCVE